MLKIERVYLSKNQFESEATDQMWFEERIRQKGTQGERFIEKRRLQRKEIMDWLSPKAQLCLWLVVLGFQFHNREVFTSSDFGLPT